VGFALIFHPFFSQFVSQKNKSKQFPIAAGGTKTDRKQNTKTEAAKTNGRHVLQSFRQNMSVQMCSKIRGQKTKTF